MGKYGGLLFFELAYERQSRGYETNDMGYLQRADEQTFEAWIGYRDHRHASTVLRWEYSPGSALFLVWANETGIGNTLTAKASSWIGR